MSHIEHTKDSFIDADFFDEWKKLGVYRFNEPIVSFDLPENINNYSFVSKLSSIAGMTEEHTGRDRVLMDERWLSLPNGGELTKNSRGITSIQCAEKFNEWAMDECAFNSGYIISGATNYTDLLMTRLIYESKYSQSRVFCFLSDIMPHRCLGVHILMSLLNTDVKWTRECQLMVNAFRAGWVPIGVRKDKLVVLPLNYEALREEWQRVSSEGGEP